MRFGNYIPSVVFIAICGPAVAINCDPDKACSVDSSGTVEYRPDHDARLKEVMKQASKAAVASIVIDAIWLKDQIRNLFPDLVGEALDAKANAALEEFKEWLKNHGSEITEKAAELAVVNLNDAVKEKHFKCKGLGLYLFCDKDFSEGGWTGLDYVLDGDSGGSSNFTGGGDFELGAAFLLEGALTISMDLTGGATLTMSSLSSVLKEPTGASVDFKAFPHGKVEVKAGIKNQTGIKFQQESTASGEFTNGSRTELKITANENAKKCP